MRLQGLGKRLAMMSAVFVFSMSAVSIGWAATRLDTVPEVYWNEDEENENKWTEAVWEPVEDAYQYEIALYRDETRVGSTVKVGKNKTTYNLKKKMDQEGDYTFRVRALAKDKDKKFTNGSWSDYSEARYITAARAEINKNGKTVDTSLSGPGTTSKEANSQETEGNQTEGQSSDGSGAAAYEEGWHKNFTGWWYCRADGTYPADGWFQDPADGRYYMLDSQGYMKTGWIVWDGKYYYCDEEGTPSGAMVTGELTIDGVLYHFDASGAALEDVILQDKPLSED